MKKFKRQQFYDWIKNQPKDRPVKMRNPSLVGKEEGCLLCEFYRDQGFKKGCVYEEEAGSLQEVGFLAKFEGWDSKDFSFIKKCITEFVQTFEEVQSILRNESAKKQASVD